VRAPEAPDSTLPRSPALEGAFRLPGLGVKRIWASEPSVARDAETQRRVASATRDNCPATAALRHSPPWFALAMPRRQRGDARRESVDLLAERCRARCRLEKRQLRACKSLSVVSAFDNEPYFLASALQNRGSILELFQRRGVE